MRVQGHAHAQLATTSDGKTTFLPSDEFLTRGAHDSAFARRAAAAVTARAGWAIGVGDPSWATRDLEGEILGAARDFCDAAVSQGTAAEGRAQPAWREAIVIAAKRAVPPPSSPAPAPPATGDIEREAAEADGRAEAAEASDWRLAVAAAGRLVRALRVTVLCPGAFLPPPLPRC